MIKDGQIHFVGRYEIHYWIGGKIVVEKTKQYQR